MSYEMIMKPSCSGCGSQSDLYGSTCEHMTLCLKCGKTMAENKGKCFECGTTVTQLIRQQQQLQQQSPALAMQGSNSTIQPQSTVHAPAKGHFALQHPQQFPSPHPHFNLQPHHRPHDLNFRQPHPASLPQFMEQASVHQQQQQQQQQHLPRQAPVLSMQAANTISVDQTSKESTPTGSKRRGGPGGLNKVCGVSPELQAVVGEPALPRTEIVKQLWAYIRKNNLQDPSNKRKIICDDALRVVFETDCTDMFKMNKLLAKHILPLEPSKESGQAKRAKVGVESTTETTEPASSTVVISEPLAKFFGTGETEMVDTEVMRRVWEYIKFNHLEDSLNPMAIHCDEKLQNLLGCESISAVGINEMLRCHLFKRS